ncbi:MAG: NAD(P)/FAD-dependent oxidoreductase, partial [Clostridia bacterium]|nr:NAD(P)/FAD-dependent oxidoreductase [Clostridia bacterium]
MSDQNYTVIIIGAGPAGIFAAMELTAKSKAKVLIIDKGSPLEERRCKTQKEYGRCLRCDPCAVTCGWGGAGAFSDGKLTLTPAFGGLLNEFIDQALVESLIDEVDKVDLSFGAPEKVYGTDLEAVKEIERRAAAAGLNLIPAKIRHLGTENCYRILEKMHRALLGRVDILMNKTVDELLYDNTSICGVRLSTGEVYEADYVICGPGRVGA